MVAVVLAAGSASRFGTTKQLAELDGQPLVARVVTAALAADHVDAVHLVVGHDGDAVTAAARRAGGELEVVVNADHAAGQATSLRAGVVSAEAAGAVGVVVLLADEPQVPAQAIDRVAAAVRAGSADAVRARYEDAAGHPVGFRRAVFDQLRAVTGDRGARDLLATLSVVEIPVAGRRPRDIDTPDDLDAAAHR